ncbi:MAG: hypothetical protein CL763_10245 [Chloroflexi bacterium]|nr:hypothetical protein [Chloroflexota bacterium]|tara:strand:+ start:5109 stop:5954 length:846 start_codon:yes stop_codon:yes gene_type:complete
MKVIEYIKTIQKQEHSFRFIVSKIFFRLKICKYFNFKYKHHILKFNPTYLSRILWVDPTHGHSGTKTEDFIWNYLEEGGIFIDVGANIGTTTLEASKKVGIKGMVFSFEANTRIFKFLKINISLNNSKNIRTFNYAIGEKSQDVFISDGFADESNSVQVDKNGILVKMKTLDEIIPRDLKIDLMKIDVLGYEKFVLKGGKQTIKNTSCIHFPAIEHFYKKYNYNYEEIFNYLEENGFIIHILDEEGLLKKISDDFKPKIGDYIAIKNNEEILVRLENKVFL